MNRLPATNPTMGQTGHPVILNANTTPLHLITRTTNQPQQLNTDENKSTTVHLPEQAGHHYEAYKNKTREHNSSKTRKTTYYATQAQTLQELILRSSPMQHPLSTISANTKIMPLSATQDYQTTNTNSPRSTWRHSTRIE